VGLSLADYVSIIVTIGTLAGAVLKLYLELRKAQKELELSKQYLKTLSKLFQSHIKRQESQQQLEKDKHEWQKLKDLAKLGKWVWEHA